MRLPPLDQYRLPLVEPLGHLVIQAAYLENALIRFIALLLPLGPETTEEQVARELRNWNPEFVAAAIAGAISDPSLAADLEDYFDRIEVLRRARHRMIHDAMEGGVDEDPDGGLRVVTLREGFRREGKTTSRHWEPVDAEEVASLAFQFYEARLDIDTFRGRLYEMNPPD